MTCGFCGSRKGCKLTVTSTTTSSSCAQTPPGIRFKLMGKASGLSPCTNRPVQCPTCNLSIWLYCVEMHFATAHAGTPVPQSMVVGENEKSAVLAWTSVRNRKRKAKPKDKEDQEDQEDPEESEDPQLVEAPARPIALIPQPDPASSSSSSSSSSGSERDVPLSVLPYP